MFEILTKIVNKHMAKNVPKKRKVSPKQALWWATDSIRRIALQALDYLPPVDVQFIDYARAVLHAHELSDPTDEDKYGLLMREVFATRGLGDFADKKQARRLAFRRYDIQRLSSSRTAAYRFLNENRRALCIPDEHDIIVADLYATDKLTEGAARRPREIVVEYVWREDVELKGPRFGPLKGRRTSLLCGGTIVFDGRGNVLYWVRKPGTGELPVRNHKEERERGIQRREQLEDYIASLVADGQVALIDERGAHGLDIWAPAVASRQVNGVLQLQVTPHLRHGGAC